MSKKKHILGCCKPLVVALCVQLVVSFGCSAGYGVYCSRKMAQLGITDTAEQTAYLAENMGGDFVMLLTAAATAVTLVIGACWYRRYRPEKDFLLRELCSGKLVLAMLCLGLSLQLLISLCLNAVYPLLPKEISGQYNELMESLLGGNRWLSLLVTVILAPFAEELLFRGITLKKAQKIMPFLAANILQAILFGIYHMNLIQGIYAFVLGMILGFTAEYFHSVWASILLHACVNGSAEVLSVLPSDLTETMSGVLFVAAVGVVLLFVAAKLYPAAKKFRENSFDE